MHCFPPFIGAYFTGSLFVKEHKKLTFLLIIAVTLHHFPCYHFDNSFLTGLYSFPSHFVKWQQIHVLSWFWHSRKIWRKKLNKHGRWTSQYVSKNLPIQYTCTVSMTILKISFFLLKLLTSWGDGSVKLFNSRLNTALLKRKIHIKQCI